MCAVTFLFKIYCNDLPAFISDAHGGVWFGEMALSCLVYANGLIILAENEIAMHTNTTQESYVIGAICCGTSILM